VIDSVEYSKEMTCQEVKVLDEVAVEEWLIVDNEALVVFQLTVM
jgi:hypothetical protein